MTSSPKMRVNRILRVADAIVGLRKVRKLIAGGWTRGTFARNARGVPVQAQDKRAVRFCPSGACWRVGGAWRLIRLIEAEIGPRATLNIWNDRPERTKAEVLALIDKTIAAEKSRRADARKRRAAA
jgi:hypothetical protein